MCSPRTGLVPRTGAGEHKVRPYTPDACGRRSHTGSGDCTSSRAPGLVRRPHATGNGYRSLAASEQRSYEGTDPHPRPFVRASTGISPLYPLQRVMRPETQGRDSAGARENRYPLQRLNLRQKGFSLWWHRSPTVPIRRDEPRHAPPLRLPPQYNVKAPRKPCASTYGENAPRVVVAK